MGGQLLKEQVNDFIQNLGAFKVGVADPQMGFTKALEGCHPRNVMSSCRSVIVYAFNIGLDYYTALDYEHNDIRLGHLYRDWTGLQLITFLRKKGYDAREAPRGHVDEKNKIAPISFKLAAYEAGIGVFGRPSMIITPEFGPRINLGVVLTDATLKPDQRKENFNPCQNCNSCITACPVNAIESKLPPPTGFDRKKCVCLVDWIRERTNGQVKLCGRCFSVCPSGKVIRKTLAIKKWTTLDSMEGALKRRLVDEFNRAHR
jgi:epoxyqueuosine reductase